MTAQITTEELDRLVDEGSDITEFIDLDSVHQPGRESNETRRVNVDFPNWMVVDLDLEADRLAINRQAVIKMLVDEGLRARRELRAS